MKSTSIAKTVIDETITISTIMLPFPELYVHPYETLIFVANERTVDYEMHSATKEEALLAHIDAIAFYIKGESE